MTGPGTRAPELAPATADLAALLAPVSAGQPAGEPLRYTEVYDAVFEARREDDPALPQGVWKAPLKRADWAEVERLCRDALERRSKDLQLAAWLLEAWIERHGAAGAAPGIALLSGLCERYWDGLHPRPEGDLERRLAPFAWLDDKLGLRIKALPIARPEAGEPACRYLDFEAARHLERLAAAQPEAGREAGDRPTLARILAAVTLTPGAHYAALAEHLGQALAALGGLTALLGRLCGEAAPGFGRLTEALTAVRHFAVRVLADRAARGEEAEEAAAGPAAGPPPAGEELPLPAGGPIRSRAEAYRRLDEAADYLLRSEPHSPAPYLVKRAVAWGALPLAELLRELVRDDKEIRTVYDLLGLRDGA